MSEYSCPCPICGKKKIFKNPIRQRNRDTPCRECAKSGSIGPTKRIYTRVCKTCGKSKLVNYKPKGTEECLSCSKKRLAPELSKKRYENYVYKRYVYFCPYCSDVRVLVSKRKTNLCGKCSRRLAKVQPIRGYFDLWRMEMRYFRICPYCPEDDNTVEVSRLSVAGIRPCRKHKHIDKEKELAKREEKRLKTLKETIAKRPKKLKKRKATTLSKEEIEKRRLANIAHKELVAKQEKPIIINTKSDEELINNWLKNNEIKVIEPSNLAKEII